MITAETDDPVLVVALDRREAGNAMDGQTTARAFSGTFRTFAANVSLSVAGTSRNAEMPPDCGPASSPAISGVGWPRYSRGDWLASAARFETRSGRDGAPGRDADARTAAHRRPAKTR
ncbi:MAG: hypothetical protein RIS35_1374 [Pseudomonadota bacterium]|jgi:hypothetical protein